MSIPPQNQNKSGSSHQREDWRGQFLKQIMIFIAFLGVLPLIAGFFGTENLLLRIVYIGVFLALVSTLIFRLPYFLKSGIFVALPLILGISSTVNTGAHGDNIFYFLTYIFFSVFFIGVRGGLLAVVISEITVITTGYLVLNEYVLLLGALASKGSLQDWVTDSVVLLLISLTVIASLRLLQEKLKESRIRNETISEDLQASQKDLESRIAARTSELAHKANQLNAALLTIHETAKIQDLDRLLSQTVDFISEKFNCYHVGIFLMNQRGDYVTLQAASSEGGRNLLDRGYRLRVGAEGIIGFVAAEKRPHISTGTDTNAIFLNINNPELPDTQSELSLPLVIRDKVIGVLDLQSSEVNAFKYEDLDIFQTMADQIAITVENTRLLSDNQLVISQLETLSNENTRQHWKTELLTNRPIFHYSATGVHPLEESIVLNGNNILNIPIVLRGQKIGKISLKRKSDSHKWSIQEEIVAKEVADQVALAIENIRLVEHTQQRVNREQAIAGISARVRETLDLDMVLRTAAREIQQALKLQEAEIRLINQDKPDGEKKYKQAGSS